MLRGGERVNQSGRRRCRPARLSGEIDRRRASASTCCWLHRVRFQGRGGPGRRSAVFQFLSGGAASKACVWLGMGRPQPHAAGAAKQGVETGAERADEGLRSGRGGTGVDA